MLDKMLDTILYTRLELTSLLRVLFGGGQFYEFTLLSLIITVIIFNLSLFFLRQAVVCSVWRARWLVCACVCGCVCDEDLIKPAVFDREHSIIKNHVFFFIFFLGVRAQKLFTI
jgi:hypothetical protein